jgi:serine/threonine-protein kinase
MSSDFRQTVANSKVSSQGSVDGAALDSINGTTAQVLVASTSKVTNSEGATQDPRTYRLIIQVEKDGDTYRASKVEFVP